VCRHYVDATHWTQLCTFVRRRVVGQRRLKTDGFDTTERIDPATEYAYALDSVQAADADAHTPISRDQATRCNAAVGSINVGSTGL